MPASIERTLEYVLLTVHGQLVLRDTLFGPTNARVFTMAAQALGLLDGKGIPTPAGKALAHPAEMAARLREPKHGPTAPYPTVRALTGQDVPTARALGLPPSARALYDRLCNEPVGDWKTMLQQCREHAQEFEDSAETEDNLPVEHAQKLAEGLIALHGSIDEHEDPVLAARMSWIAARYFVLVLDGTQDFEPHGLDDDVAVFNAVCDHLGCTQLQLSGE